MIQFISMKIYSVRDIWDFNSNELNMEKIKTMFTNTEIPDNQKQLFTVVNVIMMENWKSILFLSG